MNRLIITLVLLASATFYGQEFHGVAVYESKQNLKDMKIESKDMNDQILKEVMEDLKKQFEKTFILNFNKYESTYQEEVKLDIPSKGLSMRTSGSSDDEVTYKNVKSKLKLEEKEFFGKEFLIVDSLKVYNWELQNETKKIGNYTCYKAVSVKKVTKEDVDEYEKQKEKQETSKTSFFTVIEPREQITTVWYTPEIPISQGPGELWGLPGLILEASFNDTIVLCSKIILNPKNKTEIKIPKRGKRVTKKEFDSLIKKQMEKMTNKDGVIEIHMN
ncbi:GLPGLI family protein [Flavobacterium antarcticum]|uniref:GLPGLI family protein n=1 Tax=Flavobacterium antarcticum TaxID=271155 RepID=UPI0003B65551|nr:GLPGLI family protein [Flavobacterium antarcticum]